MFTISIHVYCNFQYTDIISLIYIYIHITTGWGPPVISLFITPSKYTYLRIIHYGYCSYVHQLS